MTKYKEFMRAKDIMLKCDFDAMSCSDFDPAPYTDFYDVEFLGTEVLDNGVMAATCSYISGREYVVVDRHGECTYYDSDAYHAYVGDKHCDPEYIDLLRAMGYDSSEWALAVMRNTYAEHAKIRLAFKHVKAGIMDERTFYKLALRYRFY